MRRIAFICVALSLLTACTPPADVTPTVTPTPAPSATAAPPALGLQAILATSEIALGESRFGLGLLKDDVPLPPARVRERFYFLGASDPAEQAKVRMELDATYYSEGLPLGVYITHPVFDQPGAWGVEVLALQDGTETPLVARVRITVAEKASTPALGAAAIASQNRTLTSVPDLSKLTSDEHPDPDLYRLTIADALANGQPTVVLFATPKFCSSRTCGPAVDVLKALKAEYGARVNFIHIEIYTDFTTFTVAPEVETWGLPSEPWLFVIDAQGKITAKFESGLTRAEVEPAVLAVLK